MIALIQSLLNLIHHKKPELSIPSKLDISSPPGFIGKPQSLPSKMPVVESSTQSGSIHPLIIETAKKYGLKPQFLDSVVYAESRYNPKAISKSGAVGLGQLTPIALKEIGWSGDQTSLTDPRTNLDLTAKYLNRVRDIRKPASPLDWYAAYSFGPYNKAPISEAYKKNFLGAYNNVRINGTY